MRSLRTSLGASKKPSPTPVADALAACIAAIRWKHAAASSAPFVIVDELTALDSVVAQVAVLEQKGNPNK